MVIAQKGRGEHAAVILMRLDVLYVMVNIEPRTILRERRCLTSNKRVI